GTTSLRAILYMDEVAGYLPPVAAPPSKKPLMVMLKQARAFGVGVMLATQNPVDLDYKALSNTGTWFIGRLQTQQDIDKVIEGLRSGAGDLDPRVSKALSALGKRVFLMKNIHESEPVIFQSRWALSYLRGPLTLAQIKKLAAPASNARTPAAASAKATFGPDAEVRPALPPQIVEYFAPLRGALKADARLIYRPGVLGLADVNFAPGQSQRVGRIAWIDEGPVPVDWEKAVGTPFSENDLEKSPEEKAEFARLAAAATRPENYALWGKNFADTLYRTAKIDLYTSASLKLTSQPGESERDFRIRISQLARERRDEAVDQLRKRYESKMAALQDRIMRAEQKVEKEKSDYRAQTMSTAVSVGATILGAFFGRKSLSSSTLSRAGSAMRSGMRTAKEHGDITNAEESLDVLKGRLHEMEQELNQEIAQIDEQTDPMQQPLETTALRPKKGDITVRLTALVWLPYWQSSDGK
ncbi:MAG TPA: ATP-binding protein, partial [bacterium]|nr:ATP-binding protein [bacterium]